MGSILPDPKKRGYLLPPGCKDLVDVLKKTSALKSSPVGIVRVNGKIRAREVRVIDEQGKHLGTMPLSKALSLAKSRSLDLVEIAACVVPPLCKICDFGQFRYGQAKRPEK
jgi:translation initiation factor IF-3